MKVRRVDFYASDWLDGTEDLTLEQRGLYITICALIYSRQRPIKERELRSRCCGRGYKPSMQHLIADGKVRRDGEFLIVDRCVKELERATTRIQTVTDNGQKGGRPRRENNDLQKPPVYTGNSQQATANNQQADFKNLERDVGRSAPAREEARDTAPPTETEKAEVTALCEQVKATLTGAAPKGIRDPAAYKSAVADSKFQAVYRAVNEAAARLDGKAREEAWRVVAAAQEAGSWAAMSKPDRKSLRALWQWAEAVEADPEPMKEAAD